MGKNKEEATLLISEVALKLKRSITTLRRWEKEGKLKPSKRLKNGWRVYSVKEIDKLRKELR